jgi:SAM-dependent methyltransferase
MGEILFDRNLLGLNRKRYASAFCDHSFLYAEVANRIVENLTLLNREFNSVLEVGAKDEYLTNLLRTNRLAKGFIIQGADDETISFDEGSFDLIVSNLNLHFINQIPQFLLQAKNALESNGIFMASFFGEENLSELADILNKTELEIYGGVSPRMPPTIDVKTAAALLQKAGFSSPISDFEKIEVEYSNPKEFFYDLKIMGQGSVLTNRSRRFMTKTFLNKIAENYQKSYGNPDGTIKATFEIVTITGWK